jgi:hypothetical protein
MGAGFQRGFMTDRYVTFTVVLEREIRSDDAEPILQAIRQIRGVADVVPQVADPLAYWAKFHVKRDILTKLLDYLKEQ